MNRKSLLLLAATMTIVSGNVFYFAYWNDIMTYGVYFLLFVLTATITIASLFKVRKKNIVWWLILIPNIYLILAQIAFITLFLLLGGPEVLFERMRGDLLRK
ncbi:hypothetical protein [Sphingobacterium griseoflavum]|uniref:Uncharacterized protein n=1 Tax=Sphingobacterium griseoflavum TaxID=1474952 RepID=A0ABQ3HS64_9SPHI|nr:hypothetical protein [Sphingobacterium griseoflavum]GHE28878.1 hypothetical protein GCM10017764_09320 [Sphingobacterium griseoflavum]